MAILMRIFSIFAVFLVLFGCCNSLQRTLNYTFNENCNELCKNTNVRLAHVRATGPDDVLHYLWDFTKNPTVFIAVTSPTAKLQINWPEFLARKANSLNFTEKPTYTFGVAIERLLEFNDINNGARINEVNNTNIKELKFENFQWHYKNLTEYDNLVEFYTQASNYKDPVSNETRHGSLKFLMHGFGTLNHSRITPCLLHSENATQVDIAIDNLETKKGFANSRFNFEILLVSESNPNASLDFDTKRKLDDEFTPGVFEIMELTTPMAQINSGYFQWRPVSYIDRDRDMSNSTGMHFYPLKSATVNEYFAKNNLLYMYYGENMFNILMQRMNISLGQEDDGYYKNTQYSTWTFIVGYGIPPDERFSSLLITIISIGVGLPLLIMLIGGIYMCVRRIPN